MTLETGASPQTFRYWAFVSYSRHDARVAGELVKRLAATPVPRELRTTVAGAPPTYAPLFLDTRDAAAAPELDPELQRALRESARLIVLCSPFAVQSGYVDDEIRYFQSLGRGADILCLIVSGVPDATDQGRPALECFPAPLRPPAPAGQRASRPLAAALQQESPQQWRAALQQLAAGLAGWPLARWRAAVSRRRARRIALAAVAVLAMAGAVWALAWAYWLPQAVYAKHAVRRWGALQPVDVVDAAAAARRPSSFRFERRGALGPWTMVREVDGSGQCPREATAVQSLVGEAFKFECTRSRACAVRMTHAEHRIVNEQVLDQQGQVLETVVYDGAQRALLSEAVVGCSRRPGNIEYILIERYDSGPLAGLDRELRFGGGKDKSPRPNSDYAFGWRLAYDPQGRVTQRQLLGQNYQPRLGRLGYAAIRHGYSDAGDAVEETTLGLDGRPVDARSGYATLRRQFDDAGRETEQRTLDALGRPVHDDKGRYGQRTAYDPRGRVTEAVNLGADGRPTPDEHGVAQLRFTYGIEEGNETHRFRYVGAGGKPVPDGTNGCAVLVQRQPPGEAWQETRCFDGNDRPAYSKSGWHVFRQDFGPRGGVVSESYFDTADRPALCIDEEALCPHHRSEYVSDERGNSISMRIFDVAGAPAVASTGVSRIDMAYDEHSRVRLLVNRGPDGQPARNHEQTVAVENVYDDFGRIVEVRRVGPDGRPLLLGIAQYARRIVYDELGNVVLSETIDPSGRRVNDNLGGPAATRQRFDSRGHRIEERFFDAQDNPTTDDQGWYGVRIQHDRWGRDISYVRLGADGRPQPGPDGELERRAAHDPRGRAVLLTLHDVDGRPMARRDGVAQWVWTVDARGNRTSERRLGLLGQLVADQDGLAGFDARFDERGRQVELLRIGPDGTAAGGASDGIARIVYEQDSRGRVQRTRFYDRNGQPKADRDGVYGHAFRYNARGQTIEEQRLAADGALINQRDGTARVETDFDAAGGIVERRFFDARNRPTATSQAAIVRYRNDPYGRELERWFLDEHAEPVQAPESGRWRVVFVRDRWGRPTQERSLGRDGQPVNRRDVGWSHRTWHYGNMGEVVEVRCADVQGRPVKTCAQAD